MVFRRLSGSLRGTTNSRVPVTVAEPASTRHSSEGIMSEVKLLVRVNTVERTTSKFAALRPR